MSAPAKVKTVRVEPFPDYSEFAVFVTYALDSTPTVVLDSGNVGVYPPGDIADWVADLEQAKTIDVTPV